MQDLITIEDEFKQKKRKDANSYSVFRAYDVRGIYPDELDSTTAYKVAKAFLRLAPGKRYVIAYDMRHSSSYLRDAIIQALVEENLEIDSLGQTTTDNLYFSVGAGAYDGGIMVTASHNASHFNGIKLVKKSVAPVTIPELLEQYKLIEKDLHYLPLANVEPTRKLDTSDDFIEHVRKFAGSTVQKPLKVVADAGNGIAGGIVTKLFAANANLQLVPMFFEPHPDFPHHEANPAIPHNLAPLIERLKLESADFGVAFDGDGDRAFFVDHEGNYIEGYYIQALLTEYFLKQSKGATVIYDLRNTRAIEKVARDLGGRAVISKAGHSFVKQMMRQEDAVFGGESSSSHFYFRDNFYADSGIITLQIVLRLISETGKTLADLVKPFRDQFFISGEKNFHALNSNNFDVVAQRLKNEFPNGAFSDFDGFTIEFSDWRFSLRSSATEPFWRLNMEANSKNVLSEKQATLFKILEEYAQFTGVVSNLYGLQTLNYTKREKLEYLFSNLLFTWTQYKGNYLDGLYAGEWARTRTPLDILRAIDAPVLDKFYEQNKYNVEESIRLQRTYLGNDTWFDELARSDKLLSRLYTEPIAYFSMEFGLTDWLQIYSGGLGILAGDTVKEASDSGLPIVGVGLFYAYGYFYQRFTPDGWQLEDYLPQDTDDYPLESVKDENGHTILVDVKLGDHIVKVKAWQLQVGRRSLLLLDTNIPENKVMEDKMICYHLYGGDEETRIKQEIVLGIGGYKILRAAGIKPSVLHLNEGHSAFAILAEAEEIINSKGVGFAEAIASARKSVLFTNHTLKQAGNDIFSYELLEKYLGAYAEVFSVDFREIFALGVDPLYADGKFGMTILGLNNSAQVNAVSEIHAVAAKKIWPDHNLVPVTNGVHLSTWVSEPMGQLLDEYVSEAWNNQGEIIHWEKIDTIPNAKLWSAHQSSKKALIAELEHNQGVTLPENSLILGWFRRFTAYKQPEVLMLDLDRLEKLINDSPVPIRFLFGGKAHPQDVNGKELFKQLHQVSQEPRFKDKLIPIADYNWRMARFMYGGCDVWINSPIRFQEACGTSGMKSGANGGLQFSTFDGWVDEIKDKGVVWQIADDLNHDQYYKTLEEQIVPMYSRLNAEGLPEEWIKRMKATMQTVLSHYGSDRMLRDYVDKLYRPILRDLSS